MKQTFLGHKTQQNHDSNQKEGGRVTSKYDFSLNNIYKTKCIRKFYKFKKKKIESKIQQNNDHINYNVF